jgi:hypothetical protein
VPKTHPPLLLRDALAGVFVSAASDADPDALAAVEALARWSASHALDPALARLVDEHGAPLFGAGGQLAESFADLKPYAADRALRFAQACAWLREDGGLGDPIEAARAAWDAGLFFEVHEILEPVWLRETGARKVALQGLIMAGAALHHLTQSNTAGASGLLREAAARLRDSRPGWPPLALDAFADGLASLAAAVARGEVRNIADVPDLPALERSAAP